MPELPEVETLCRDLSQTILGRSFLGARAFWEKSLVLDDCRVEDAVGGKVTDVMRRGKFLSILLDNDFVLTIHLRMSGRIIAEKSEDGLDYERVRLIFSELNLKFCDMRKFGRVWLSKMNNYEKFTGIWKLGIEPLEKTDYKVLKGQKGIVKKVLLDQSVYAGIGNIYADEACFYAGIRPDTRIETLNDRELKRLFEGVKKALNQGIRNRGTSISDFHDAYGKSGKNQEVLFVYGRGKDDCLRCGASLKKGKLAGRTTVWCERCQK